MMSPTEFRDYITNRLKTERMRDIADDFGVSQQAVSLWINGGGMSVKMLELASARATIQSDSVAASGE